MPNDEPILIAGAGPAGMIAALALAQREVPVIVFEAEAALPATRRATTFHPPTLDMLEELGLADDIIRLGAIAPKWQFRDRATGKVAEFDVALMADVTGHPYRVQCEQFHLTGTILERLNKIPQAEVRFNSRVTGFKQARDAVTAIIERPAGTERVGGRYLVGADGHRSRVRDGMPVEFEGFTYEERIVQAGTRFDYTAALPDIGAINYISDPEEWCVLLKLPDYWRVGFPMREDETDEEALADETMETRLQRFFPKSERYEIMHRNCWRVHQKVAADFRHGRVVLAGDAAHVNSPQGGMGMNSGIHDGVNLGDKLATIWRGDAADEVLDLYTRQRRAVAVEDVKVQTMRNAELMNQRDPERRRLSLDRMRETAADPAKARQFLLQSSMYDGLRRAAEIQ